MFVDERNLTLFAGDGGDGVIHWHREKFIPKGGPDGGNGGRGGDMYIEAVRDINILSKYREKEVFSAHPGNPGKGNLCSGKGGEDYVLRIPIGSVITNKSTNEVFEMIEEGQKVLVASGGEGGLGNAHFKGPTNTTPTERTLGEKAQTYDFHIELNLIADVGIIGLPNAGKSTLLNSITNANAKIGDYMFTTLEPNLAEYHKYIFADIPGIIKNASEGKGLGHKFLRHIRRTRILLHLVSCENENITEAYKTIRTELEKYDTKLTEKKEIIVLSKVDLISKEKVNELLKELPKGALALSVIDDDLLKGCTDNVTKIINSEEAIN